MNSLAPRTLNWLLIGDIASPHFAPAHELLKQAIQHQADTLIAAISWLESSHQNPDAVLVYQSVPDEYPPKDVDRLIGLIPLARWVVCLGPWCESIGRTEQVWPVAWCVPLKDVAPQIARTEFAHTIDEPIQPPTASRDESFSRTASDLARCQITPAIQAAVTGDDPPFIETATDLLQSCGCVIVEPSTAALIVLVLRSLQPTSLNEISELRRTAPQARLVIASDLLTAAEIAQVRSSGADTVVSTLRFSDALIDLFRLP